MLPSSISCELLESIIASTVLRSREGTVMFGIVGNRTANAWPSEMSLSSLLAEEQSSDFSLFNVTATTITDLRKKDERKLETCTP